MAKIFISHSVKDQIIVEKLYELFSLFINDNNLDHEKYSIFYAAKGLKSIPGSKSWKNDIINNMKNSTHCVVLFSRNSIENKWVNYELGLATAFEITIIPICVDGVKNYSNIILNEQQIIPISDYDNVYNVMSSLFPKDIVNQWLVKRERSELIRNLNTLAKERCVYIVGSKPKDDNLKEDWENTTSEYIREFANKLLKTGFKLASFPSVQNVGAIVAECAVEYDIARYEIAGLYDFDRVINRANNLYNNWNYIIEEFRNIYLQNKEYMIIVAGGENTEQEYKVAKKIKTLTIIPLPCFGGFGEKLYNNLKDEGKLNELNLPCNNCYNGKNTDPCKCKMIVDIVENLFSLKICNK